MKTLLAMITFFSANIALACPALSGTYLCDTDGKVEKMIYETSTKDGVTYLSVNGSEPLKVDGKMRDFPVGEEGVSMQVGIRCKNPDKFVIKSDMVATDNKISEIFCGDVPLTVNIAMALTVAGDSIQETNQVTFMCGDGSGEDDKISGKYKASCRKVSPEEAASVEARQFPFPNKMF